MWCDAPLKQDAMEIRQAMVETNVSNDGPYLEHIFVVKYCGQRLSLDDRYTLHSL